LLAAIERPRIGVKQTSSIPSTASRLHGHDYCMTLS
jgi:hypothetical protein